MPLINGTTAYIWRGDRLFSESCANCAQAPLALSPPYEHGQIFPARTYAAVMCTAQAQYRQLR